MMFSRRGFVGALSAAALVPRFVSAAEAPLLRFGVLSDCHIRDRDGDTDRLIRVFRHLGDAGCRLVGITGDLCELGTMEELGRVVAAWKAVFPDGVNSRGGRIELTACWGNHDYHDESYLRGTGIGADRLIINNRAEAWKLLTGEDWQGEISLRTVDGIDFISAHWGHLGEELDRFLDALPPASDRPRFLFQHPHPYRTCFCKWYPALNRPNFLALMKHPELFVMSGHSHISNGFDDALWQGGFVSMAAGCAARAGGRRYEYNVQVPKEKAEAGEFRHMPPNDVGDTFQASVVTVYPSRVVVSRFDLANGVPLGEDWNLPFPFEYDREHPFRIAEGASAPEFPSDASIRFEVVEGVRYPDLRKVPQLRLTFPCAGSTGPYSRVMDYRTEVFRADGTKVRERLVAQSGIALAERFTRLRPGSCVFGAEELPAGERLRFSVAPLNAAGRAGRPLVSWTELPVP